MKLARVRSCHFPISKTTKSYPICDRRIPRDPIRELHAHFIRTHQHRNPNAMSEVIKSYALNQMSMQKARFAFVEIDHPTLPIWNHMIRGLSQSDSPLDALDLFDKMREEGVRGDNLTFIFACKASGRVSDVLYGKRVHVHVLKLGFGSYLYVCNALIHMYGSCGYLGSSRRVFDAMDEKDLVSWNSLICAYSQCAKYEEVLGLFNVMRVENVKADAVTMVKVVLACNYLGEWKLVDSMVEYIEDNCVEIDVYLGNTLIDVYGRRGSIALARGFFDRMTERNFVSWNAMIIGAAKSGDLAAAKKLFDEMPDRDVISWTSMITGYCQANRHDDAVTLFQEMMTAKVKPDQITVASVLSACAHLGRLDVGKAVHDYVSNNSIKLDIYVENALIDMYCKCGSVEKALNVFYEMKEKDSVSWTSVISGLAVNGNCDRAVDLFSQMLREGTRPIHGTFVGILLACVHAGLVDKGLEFFRSMQKDYGLVPEMRHYGCVVDLLCRAGNLHRAYEFIKNMPVFPDIVVWRILLSACKLHGNLMLAKIASERLLELDPTNGGNYVLSSNSYASAERWDDAIKMRELMNKGDVLKPLGQSSIETNHEISRLSKNMLD
ncbi:Pentatricopeptide repeat-containing protein, mitochondrial [Sesamum angolense]|uniref:Pentatricopeptide repeat-containing protein, mitochondrial n=1 Tax=Sesamum angolense TaxID=2727404 RepID=A0AAE1X1R5_9LAMI|nr:Pentatricopeptide repeat-containing protein, mitochondrial [Sesamum angolense]